MNAEISYGRSVLELEVDDRRVVGVIKPNAVAETPDIDSAVWAALASPHESPPLAELLQGKRSVLLLTVDRTRPSPRPMILPILDLCEKEGARVTVMIALGRHRMMTDAELREHLGDDVMARCTVTQHDTFDAEAMVEKGVTSRGTPIRVNRAVFEHDLVVGCGIIEPSYLAGWSGGRKLLMPGLAWHESIDNNHYYLTDPDTRIGRLHGNPVSDDAAEFARDLPLHFILYTVNGPRDEVVSVVAGHPVKAHEEACRQCESIYRVAPRTADIVISSAGGFPYDCDLVQGKKAIIPAIEAVNRNGVVILCAECPDGLGAEKTFINWLGTKTPAQVVRDVRDRSLFNLGAHGANILARPIVEKNAKIVLVANETVAEALRGTYVTALTDLADAWALANLLTAGQGSVLLIENARRLIVG